MITEIIQYQSKVWNGKVCPNFSLVLYIANNKAFFNIDRRLSSDLRCFRASHGHSCALHTCRDLTLSLNYLLKTNTIHITNNCTWSMSFYLSRILKILQQHRDSLHPYLHICTCILAHSALIKEQHNLVHSHKWGTWYCRFKKADVRYNTQQTLWV